jgi:translation initiation factor IF-2
MKTLTEISGSLVRRAAAAIAEAKQKLPREAPPPAPVEEAPVADAAPAVEAVEAAPATDAPPADAAATEAPAAEAKPAAKPAPKADAKPAGEPPESDAAKAAFDAAVEAATGVSGDRLARLRDAVKVAGRKLEDVRLVRVFGVEEPVAGATTLNGFQYVVDHAPASMKQEHVIEKKKGFGGKGRGGPGGAGSGGGGGGKGAPTSGGFSMDSLREDRKGQRKGPGGGRGR